MDLQLNGKRALVTGSTSGLGEAIAKTLASEGATVVIQGRRENEAKRVTDEILAAGGKAIFVTGDLAIDAEADAVANAILDALGGVDILVNNAGIAPMGNWFETPADTWLNVYNLNVAGMVRMVNRFAPTMKEQGWGRIIAISSGEGIKPNAYRGAYSASKGAIINLSISLANAFANTGVTSNTISPGLIWTAGVDEVADQMGISKQKSEREQKLLAEWAPNPTGRIGSPEDIAATVAFVASPKAGYINGANIRVDGGATPTTN